MSKEELDLVRVDPRVLQAILLHRMDRKLRDIASTLDAMNARLEAVEARGIPFSPTKIHQWKTIKAGKSGVVYNYDVRPYVAFIHYVGCKWFANTYYLWEIDGVHKEWVERIIGNVDAPTSEPLRLEKPLVARKKIVWRAYNEDTADHVFEVLCDGILYPPRVAQYLGGAEL